MGISYTKKEGNQERQERMVPAEEFIKRLLSSQRNPDQIKELPKTEIKK